MEAISPGGDRGRVQLLSPENMWLVMKQRQSMEQLKKPEN